jgi:hypothetical protein
MESKTEVELRSRIVLLETRIGFLEREYKDLIEGINPLLREMVVALRSIGRDAGSSGTH